MSNQSVETGAVRAVTPRSAVTGTRRQASVVVCQPLDEYVTVNMMVGALKNLGLVILRLFVGLFITLSLTAMIMIFVSLFPLVQQMKERYGPTIYTFYAGAILFIFAFAMLLTALWVWRWLKK